MIGYFAGFTTGFETRSPMSVLATYADVISGYRVFVSKASTARVLAELPVSDLRFARLLSSCGDLSATLPLFHASVTEVNLGLRRDDPDREVSVFRRNNPVWNGPLTAPSGARLASVVQLRAQEASYYLIKRTLEETRDYTGWDRAAAVEDLLTYMVTKTSNGADGSLPAGSDIVAAIPRFGWDTSSLAGVTLGTVKFSGAACHSIQDCLEKLAADPETGFEWRMVYSVDSSAPRAVMRTLQFGAPTVGVTCDVQLTEHILQDFTRDEDLERGGTRVHGVSNSYTKTLQNAGAVADGVLLTETTMDLTDIADTDVVDATVKDLRRLAQPMPRKLGAAWVPNDRALGFDAVDLGDVVPFQIIDPDPLSITSNSRRVVGLEVVPPSGGAAELVTATFSDPLTDLGA